MEKVLVGKRTDGGVSIIYPAPGATEEAAFREELLQDFVSHRLMNKDELPASREWRNAWCDTTDLPSIDIDMSKAKEIALEKLRFKRDAALKKLDEQTLIALGKGDDIKRIEIEQEKQKLRDATEPLKAIEASGFNNYEVLEQLKTFSKLQEN